MAATRSSLCIFFVVAFMFIATTGQHIPCIMVQAPCAKNEDCNAPCKANMPPDLYCPDTNICDDTACCCRQNTHCPTRQF
ncbi:hypothetical protein DEO72_LG6g2338 [Vigna unguiculata]|uniref:Uncharacterized protein n=1 Tax=Vigna unguiculata TaxID=3917 RepID=A0A4D6M9G6_VIGUN|nr:hypothetical protein DEO72_LG6g2338 [Vigna unguiculata]